MAKRIPDFKSPEEVESFVENEDLGEYALKFEPVSFLDNRSGKKVRMTMSINPDLKRTISLLARRKGIPYQTLIQMWLKERTDQELKQLAK